MRNVIGVIVGLEPILEELHTTASLRHSVISSTRYQKSAINALIFSTSETSQAGTASMVPWSARPSATSSCCADRLLRLAEPWRPAQPQKTRQGIKPYFPFSVAR